MTIDEALRIGTLHGAYASFEEDSKGSIECGKLADLVVLGRHPKQEDPFTLVTIPIERAGRRQLGVRVVILTLILTADERGSTQMNNCDYNRKPRSAFICIHLRFHPGC